MNSKKLHYFSGITISIFVILHLINHLYSLFGADAHIEMMNDLRVVYRNIIAEVVLLLAVVIQVFTGSKLFLKRRKNVLDFFERLQIWTGLYLVIFFLIHLSAVLSGRLILDIDTNFYFGVAGLNTFPLNLFFIPYYGLAIISFFGHISAVHSKKMIFCKLTNHPADEDRNVHKSSLHSRSTILNLVSQNWDTRFFN